MRLLTKDWYYKMQDYDNANNKKFVEDKLKEYAKIEEEQLKNESIEFLENSFHDAIILQVKQENKDLILEVDPELTEKINIIFKNYTIILDENIEKCSWLYDEIYKVDNGYEIHILSINYETDELKELIINCDYIILQ